MIRFKYIIIFVLVLILIIVLLKGNQIKEKFNSNKYYLELEDSGISKKPQNIGEISLVLFYKEGCSITREFLYGCCNDYIGIISNTSGTKIIGNEEEETGYEISPAPTTVNISKNENYITGTKCPPLKFFSNMENEQHTCIQQGESTFSKLKIAVKKLNEEFKKYGIIIPDDITYLGDSDLNPNDLFNLNIKIYLIEKKFTDEEIPFLPLLRLYIPHKYNESVNNESIPYLCNNHEYLNPINYDKNINNLCQIFHFLYQNITFSFDGDNKTITLFEKTKTKREGKYIDTDITTLGGTENLIKDFLEDNYSKYCNSEPLIHLIHNDPTEVDDEISIKSMDAETSYIESRPKMFWENINPIDEEGKELKYVLIILRHNKLTEYYSNSNKNDNLIYWMGWGIPIENPDIPFKRRKQLSDISDENFSEVYPYVLFKEDSIQTYSEDIFDSEKPHIKINDIIKNLPFPIDLNVKIFPEIYGLTEENKLFFDQIYNKYHNRKNNKFFNLKSFYEEFLAYISDQKLKTTTQQPIPINIKYVVSKSEDKKKLQSYFKQNFIKDEGSLELKYDSNEKEIRVFSYNNIFIKLSENKNRVIDLPSKIYYEIHFEEEDLKIKINDIPISYQDNIYRIPFTTDKFIIKSNENTNIILKESKFVTKQLIWENLVSSNDYMRGEIESITLNKNRNITISFSRASRVRLLFTSTQPDLVFTYDNTENNLKNEGIDEENNNLYNIDSNISVSKIIISNIKNGTKLNNGSILFYDKSLTYELESKENKKIKLSNKTFWELKDLSKGSYEIYINDKLIEYFDDDYIYKLPFITDSFELYVKSKNDNPTKKEKIEISESEYISQPILWTTYLSIDSYTVNPDKSLTLSKSIPDITIYFQYPQKYKFMYKKNNDIIKIVSYENLRKELKISGLQTGDILHDGIITIIKSVNNNDFSKNRITDKNLEFKNCIDQFVGHQLLPSISVKNDKISNLEDYYFGLEIFYYDKNGIKKPVYLEWDIDPEEDTTLISYSTFKFRCNKDIHNDFQPKILKLSHNSLNYYENDEYDMGGDPSPSPSICDLKLKNCNKKKIKIKISQNPESLPNKIKIVIPKDNKKINNLFDKKYDLELNNFRYKLQLNSKSLIELIYNLELKIWQLWVVEIIDDIYNEDTNIYNWVANQKQGDYIFNPGGSVWLFSPNYNDNIEQYDDFFSYPNWFRRNTKMSSDSLSKTKQLKIIFKISDEEKNIIEKEIYDCNESNMNTSKLECKTKYDDIKHFRNTLFNIPNISESIKEGTLNPKKLIVKHLTQEDEFMMDAEYDTNLYYSIDLRANIHLYNKNNNEVDKEADGKYIFNLPDNENDPNVDFINSYKRILSELVKKNYINNDFYTDLVNELKENDFKSCANLLENLSNDLLIHKGDLDKNSIINLKGIITKNKLNALKFNYHKIGDKRPNSQHIVDDKRKIDTELYKIFLKYINENKVHTKNYTSYGPIQLNQNETLLRYKFPIDIKCLKKIENQIVMIRDDELKLKLEINLFYSNTNNIRKLYTKLNDYLSSYFSIPNTTYAEMNFNSVKNILLKPFKINDSNLKDFNPQEILNTGSNLLDAYQYFLDEQMYQKTLTIYDIKSILDNISYLNELDVGTETKISIEGIDMKKISSKVDFKINKGIIKYLNIFREINILFLLYQIIKEIFIRLEEANNKQLNIIKSINSKLMLFNNKLQTEKRFLEAMKDKLEKTVYESPGPSPPNESVSSPPPDIENNLTSDIPPPIIEVENTPEDVINHYKKMIFQIFSDGEE